MDNTTSSANNITIDNIPDKDGITGLAASYLLFKIGYFINKYYFPILTPIGIIGNVLSFLVMVQKQNRHMSMSVYLAVLAVDDTIVLASGYTLQLAMQHNVEFPPNQYWYCSITITILSITMLYSSLLLVAMTFDRFYSIVRPHKAASFNTVRKTKIIIFCTGVFSIVLNVPHLLLSDNEGWQCTPFGKASDTMLGTIFYWFSSVVGFVIPFILLLTMNSVIIHKLRTRYVATQAQSETSSRKNSEGQIFVMLLLVTFGFLILVTPAYVLYLYVILVDVRASPKAFAGYYLFHSVAQKMRFTNHGVNFLFYVISGEKFRADLKKLLPFEKIHKYRDMQDIDSKNTTVTY